MFHALVLAGTIAQLADAIVAQAPERGTLAVRVAGPGQLGERVAELAIGRLREHGRVVSGGSGADWRLDAQVTARGERLLLSGGVLDVAGAVWRRAAGLPDGDTVGRIFAQVTIDAEARHLAATAGAGPATRILHRPEWAVRALPVERIGAETPLLALALGDARGDGHLALIGLTERELVVFPTPLQASASPASRTPLGGPPAPVFSRSPVGAVLVDRPGSVLARSSSRAGWLGSAEISAGKWPLGTLPGGALLVGTFDPGRGCFNLAAPWPVRVRAVATATIGGVWFAATVDEGGQLAVHRGAPGQVQFQAAGVGDAVALWDADGDGEPEVASSLAVPPDEDDQIVVRNLRGEVWRSALIPGAVTALTAGELAEGTAPTLVAAVQRRAKRIELWIVR
jgi:hypothetical protein